MLHLPCFILSGLLGLLLVVREAQNHRIQKGLIDKILVSRGSDELPSSPVEKAISKLTEERKPYSPEQEKAIKDAKSRVHFQIPGMPSFKEK